MGKVNAEKIVGENVLLWKNCNSGIKTKGRRRKDEAQTMVGKLIVTN